MTVIRTPAALDALWSNRETRFEDMMKIVVDVENGVLAADAELHADLEAVLLRDGSKQEHLWGANLYPLLGRENADFIECTALVNIRPSAGNPGMEIVDPSVRAAVKSVVLKLLG